MTTTLTAADATRAQQVQKEIERWVRGSGPTYDCVVIVGGHGITTHSFAARLARSEQFAGKLVLAGPAKQESRRLIGGVSVRAKAADYLAHATGMSHGEFIDHLAGGPCTASTRQVAAMAFEGPGGSWAFTRPGPWQNHRRNAERPVMYGFRNSRTAVAIREAIADGTISEVVEAPTSLSDALDLAPGSRPLIVNATRDDQLLGNLPGSHRWGIVAAQVPFSGAPQAPLENATTFAPLVRREGAIDVGYYTPFDDALSPDATWYGIIARPVRADELVGPRGEHHKAVVTRELLGIGAACALTPVDPDETMGIAAVPGADWSSPRSPVVPGTLELRQVCSAGIPAYYADGILCGAVGGVTAAEAVLRGADPTASASAAIARIRWWNRLWWIETTKLSAVADRLMRVNVSMAMAYPHSSSAKWWASAA